MQVREAKPGEVEAFLKKQVPATTLEWKSVGVNWHEWFKRVGDYPTEQGTLLRTERGVFMCGMCGSFFVGQKRNDGTLDNAECGLDWQYSRDELILEYADTPGCGYTRNEAGAIVLSEEEM
jgi:hypothetical protein